jgi:hypothetical protein
MNKKFILGGGISSLIWKFYNSDFTIISPEVGGEFLKGIQSVSWIHDTEETRKLLTDLGLFIDPYEVKIGYYYNGFVHNDCPEKYKQLIAQKKMTTLDSDEQFPSEKLPSSVLSTESNVLKTLHVDFNTVFDLLKKNIDCVIDKVVKIDDVHFLTEKNQKYEYQTLISTIPAPFFWDLYNHPRTFEYLPVTFVETWDKPLIYNDDYQMIYFAEDYTFTRIAKKEPALYSYEFTGKIDNIKQYLPNVRIQKLTTRGIGRLISQTNLPPNNKITFLGRLATWEYSSKIQDVIKKSLNYASQPSN